MGKTRNILSEILPVDEVLSNLDPGHRKTIRLLAEKPSPALLHVHNVGEPIEFHADYVWHSLEKEKSFAIPERGNLGLVQPNSDISYILGFKMHSEALVSRPVSEFLVHNHDAIVEDIRFRDISYSWLQARVFFMPLTSSGLAIRLEITNTGAFDKEMRVFSTLHRNPKRPRNRYQREYYHSYGLVRRSAYTSAGKLRAAKYLDNSDCIMLIYDEHRPGKARPIGKLACGLRGEKKSSGRFFTNTPGSIGKSKTPEYSGHFYDLKLGPGETRTIRISVQFQRYDAQEKDNPYISRMSESECIRTIVKRSSDLLKRDMKQHLMESINACRNLPTLDLPERKYPPAVLASLDMVRGEICNPAGRMKRPFYSFCRLDSAALYDWWNYGQHGHESISLVNMAITNPQLAGEMLLNHIDFQEPDGKVPYGVGQKGIMPIVEATMPLLTWLTWNTYLWSGDRKFLAEAYNGCKKSHQWWMTNRTDCESILCNWLTPHETARDIAAMPVWKTIPMEDFLAPDVNSCLLKKEETLAHIALELDLKNDHRYFSDLASRRSKLMNELMWDEKDHCYYGVSRRTRRKVRIKDVGSLMPLWAGAPSRSRAKRMVGLIRDPGEFWTPYPIPTLALSDADFGNNVAMPPEENWPNAQGAAPCMGDNWPEMTYFIAEGLERYGYYGTGGELSYRNMKMVLNDLINTSHFREHYDSISGFGTGLYDYAWSSIASAFLVRFILGIRPRADGLYIRPELPADWDAANMANLHVRGYTIDITVGMTRQSSKASINGRSCQLDSNGSAFISWQRKTKQISIEYFCKKSRRKK